MNYIVTGATGYIGRRVLKMFCENHIPGDKLLTINKNVDKAKTMFREYDEFCVHTNIDDEETILNFKADVVVHLATLSTSSDDKDIIEPLIEANILFGVKLLDIVTRANQLAIFVNIGTFAEYRFGNMKQNNAYLYSASKSAFRSFLAYYADKHKFRYITLVPYTVYGDEPNNDSKKLIDYMVDSINSETPIGMTKGEQILDFIHIDDVIEFFKYMYLYHEQSSILFHGTEMHLGTGVGTRVNDIASMIEKTHNVKCNISWGARPYRPMDIMYAVAPATYLSSVLKWKPQITIEEGIKRLNINN